MYTYKHLIVLTLLSLSPIATMADDISDRLAQITQALNNLKTQPSSTTTNQVKESNLNNHNLSVIKTKKRLAPKMKSEEVSNYEAIGSLIKTPDLLSNPLVTLLSLSPAVYDYLISSSINPNFHLDAPHYSQDKMLNIVGYAPSNSEVWCIINNQKVILNQTQLNTNSQSVIYAGFFKAKSDNEFSTYQYSPCYIKSAQNAYKNMVLLKS